MTASDVAPVLRKVDALRALCLRLPHIATPAEERLLRRFGRLAESPHDATHADAEALAAGWRCWWREGDVEALHRMGAQVPRDLIAQDRSLAALWVGASLSRWEMIQSAIWHCTVCAHDARVAMNARQRTDPPRWPIKLVIVSLAPPFAPLTEKTRALSATNNPDDKLRRFIEDALNIGWDALSRRGLSLLHAVKCGIVPNNYGSQNPPRRVVDLCVPHHLAAELSATCPGTLVTMGDMAYRALVRSLGTIPGVRGRHRLTLTAPRAEATRDGYAIGLESWPFTLFKSPFIRTARDRATAGAVLRRAALRAGIG